MSYEKGYGFKKMSNENRLVEKCDPILLKYDLFSSIKIDASPKTIPNPTQRSKFTKKNVKNSSDKLFLK